MTIDVINASTVSPASNGGGRWPVTNSCGFALITPGKDTYTAFWIRDFSMASDSGLIPAPALGNHLLLICEVQNGPTEIRLAHGLHLPPWAIPDHINYDGRPSFFPGTYSSGDDQGQGTFGRLPPVDDHYEFIHIAYLYWRLSHDHKILEQPVKGVPILERLHRAFDCPACDPATGLVETTEQDRAVGFGFCDAEVHTGKLLFASLLRYRAAGELAQMDRDSGRRQQVSRFLAIQKSIQTALRLEFHDPADSGWLRASTGISRQPDVWGTLFALHLRVLSHVDAAMARKAVAIAARSGTIVFDGAVRHVPTNMDFNSTTAWERSVSPLNTYQNGGYWHTASGWLIEALWSADKPLARQVFAAMMLHLRGADFRKEAGSGAPWEVWGPRENVRQNPVYMASVALPYSILKGL
ncbi:MAG TPA: hypothetical protein VL793_03455 [Patescibacteria group bacterium]|nr:hypothetical protein [Patescibacteria group bacterium]